MVSVAEPPGDSSDAVVPARPRSSTRVARTSASSPRPKVIDPARESLQARHHARVVGVDDGPRRRAGLVEDLGLGVCDRIRGREESDVRVSDIGPHADVRLGNFDEPSDFSRVIHAQLHHRDVRPRRQLEQRERQADVVVQVPGVAIHRVSRREERRRCFLRRRLARASRNRDDVGARLPPHVVAEPLERRAACRPPRSRPRRAGRRSPCPRGTITPIAPPSRLAARVRRRRRTARPAAR